MLAPGVVEAARQGVPAELRKLTVTGAEKYGRRQVKSTCQSVVHLFDVRDVILFASNLGAIKYGDKGSHFLHSPVLDPAQIAKFQCFPFRRGRVLAGVVFKQACDLGPGAEKIEGRHMSLSETHEPVVPNQVEVFKPEIHLSIFMAFRLLCRYMSNPCAFDYGHELGADAVPDCRSRFSCGQIVVFSRALPFSVRTSGCRTSSFQVLS